MQYNKQPFRVETEGKVFLKPDRDSPLLKYVYDLENAISRADIIFERHRQNCYVAPVDGGYIIVDIVEHRQFFNELPGEKVVYKRERYDPSVD